jgi:hypothetical protein
VSKEAITNLILIPYSPTASVVIQIGDSANPDKNRKQLVFRFCKRLCASKQQLFLFNITDFKVSGLTKTPRLCRIGLHKWRNYGDRVMISWTESGLIPLTKKDICKHVFCERECLRCGIKERRLFSENIDGTKSAAGWERIGSNQTKTS